MFWNHSLRYLKINMQDKTYNIDVNISFNTSCFVDDVRRWHGDIISWVIKTQARTARDRLGSIHTSAIQHAWHGSLLFASLSSVHISSFIALSMSIVHLSMLLHGTSQSVFCKTILNLYLLYRLRNCLLPCNCVSVISDVHTKCYDCPG